MSRETFRIALVIVVWLIAEGPARAQPGILPDAIWTAMPHAEGAKLMSAMSLDRRPPSDAIRYFRLDVKRLSDALTATPRRRPKQMLRFGPNDERPPEAIIPIPIQDGRVVHFQVVDDPVLSPALAERYADIRTFLARGMEEPDWSAQLDITPAGFHAQIHDTSGTILVNPVNGRSEQSTTYAVFRKEDLPQTSDFRCEAMQAMLPKARDANAAASESERSDIPLRTFRLAVACTVEYAAYFCKPDDSVAVKKKKALAAVASTIHRVNGVFGTELAVRFKLVDNNSDILFVDKDDFENDDGEVLMEQSQVVIDKIIGPENYDIGHTFSTGGGGIAMTPGIGHPSYKAMGVTGRIDPVNDAFNVDYVAHEMGHQCGANHTFNGKRGDCSDKNRNVQTAVEPGSGSTIMGYPGICDTDDLQPHADRFFHAISLYEMQSHLANVPAFESSPTNNHAPIVDVAIKSATIPAATPFVLRSSGGDRDGDRLVYTWDQMNIGPAAHRGTPDDGTIPLFRSRWPSRSSARVFPQLAYVLTGSPSPDEFLPQMDRTLNFRVTARDMRLGGGGVGSADVVVNVHAAAGPFRVTAPANHATVAKRFQVRWDVARTDQAPVNCARVGIRLSTDGGQAFKKVLVQSTENDGEETVLVEGVSITDPLRVLVSAEKNVFIAVSPEFHVDPTLADAAPTETGERENAEPGQPPSAGKVRPPFDSPRLSSPQPDRSKLPTFGTPTIAPSPLPRAPGAAKPAGRAMPADSRPERKEAPLNSVISGAAVRNTPVEKPLAPTPPAPAADSAPTATAPAAGPLSARIKVLHFDADGFPVDDRAQADLVRAVRDESPTDVIVLAHGWNNTPATALDTYKRVIDAVERAGSGAHPGAFRPLIIGVAWPSKAWVDEEAGATGGIADDEFVAEPQMRRLAVLDALDPKVDPANYRGDVEKLQSLLDLPSDRMTREQFEQGVALLRKYSQSAPAVAAAGLDAVEERSIFDDAPEATHGLFGDWEFKDAFRVFTFWQMKRRAGIVGANGMQPFLAEAMATDARFHLVGHSFGCKLVLSAIAAADRRLPKPVESVVLLQGAVSAHAFANRVPGTDSAGGYRSALSNDRVRGPIIATFTSEDWPLGWAFPLGTRLNRDTGELRAFGSETRSYEALGSVGMKGMLAAVDKYEIVDRMKGLGEPYPFALGKRYSVRATAIHGHSDLDHDEVGWLIWNGLFPAATDGATAGPSAEERDSPKSMKAAAAAPSLFRLPADMARRQISSFDSAPQSRLAASAVDTDRDGLNDSEEQQLGTDPKLADTDGDSLSDSWEVHGVNGIDLHALGASPLHKDIFVEMDYMTRGSAANGLKPGTAVLDGIQVVFASAPVSNPDGRPGINIHLQLDEEVPHDPDLNNVYTEFAVLKGAHFAAAKAPVYHYMIWADGYAGGTSSGLSMGIPASDFVVTLGLWNGGTGGNDREKIGTFVHELGHNLGLRHGGSEDRNLKPNHLSLMNYSFQTRGIWRGGIRVFDYQPFELPELDEQNLIESEGIHAPPAASDYRTIFWRGGAGYEVDAGRGIDWNLDGSVGTAPQATDLNKDTALSVLLKTPNEWSSLVFNGGSIGSRAPLQGALQSARNAWRPLPFEELTEELDKSLRGP